MKKDKEKMKGKQNKEKEMGNWKQKGEGNERK